MIKNSQPKDYVATPLPIFHFVFWLFIVASSVFMASLWTSYEWVHFYTIEDIYSAEIFYSWKWKFIAKITLFEHLPVIFLRPGPERDPTWAVIACPGEEQKSNDLLCFAFVQNQLVRKYLIKIMKRSSVIPPGDPWGVPLVPNGPCTVPFVVWKVSCPITRYNF